MAIGTITDLAGPNIRSPLNIREATIAMYAAAAIALRKGFLVISTFYDSKRQALLIFYHTLSSTKSFEGCKMYY